MEEERAKNILNISSFIEVQLLYNIVLVSAVHKVNQLHVCVYIYTHIHVYTHMCTHTHTHTHTHTYIYIFRSPQSIEQSSLYYTVNSHLLSILYTLAYICQPQSPNPFHVPFPTSIHLYPTSVSLFLLCKYILGISEEEEGGKTSSTSFQNIL